MSLVSSVFLGLVAVLALRAQDENQSTADYTVIADVQYCTGAGKPLLMDVFVPRRRIHRPTPAILWLHGGSAVFERLRWHNSAGGEFQAAPHAGDKD
jgi:acetyl esterase/lipase